VDSRKTMKIGMVSDTFYPKIGGAEIHLKELCKALGEFGHDVSVLTFTDGSEMVDGIPVTRLQYSPWDPDTGASVLLREDLRKMRSYIKKQDVIHTHYTFMSSAIVGLLNSVSKKPLVTTLHGLGTLESSVEDSKRMKAFRRLSFLTADKVVSTSEEMAEVASRFISEDHIEVIPNAVDTEYFRPKEEGDIDESGTYTILSVRRLNPKNGVQYLIDASPIICDRIDDVEILIAGNGGKKEMMVYLKDRVTEHGTKEQVDFLGEVPNEKTRDLYDAADTVAFPSSAESTSIACLEAMSMECAIVASDLSAYKTLLGDEERGLLVELFDRHTSDYDAPMTLPEDRIRALAESIIELSEEPELRKELGENARRYTIEQHDWSVIAKKIETIYYSILRS